MQKNSFTKLKYTFALHFYFFNVHYKVERKTANKQNSFSNGIIVTHPKIIEPLFFDKRETKSSFLSDYLNLESASPY